MEAGLCRGKADVTVRSMPANDTARKPPGYPEGRTEACAVVDIP